VDQHYTSNAVTGVRAPERRGYRLSDCTGYQAPSKHADQNDCVGQLAGNGKIGALACHLQKVPVKLESRHLGSRSRLSKKKRQKNYERLFCKKTKKNFMEKKF